MDDRAFRERARSLEESFFKKQNQALLEKLRKQAEATARRDALAAASGIHDETVLDRLVELELCGETVAALSLVPLLEVAWADREVHENERNAIVSAAEASGVDDGSPAHDLLENWLRTPPEEHFFDSWGEYVGGLCERLDETGKAALKADILGRARAVAEAAGGFLGLGNKVSKEEREVLERLEQAFV